MLELIIFAQLPLLQTEFVNWNLCHSAAEEWNFDNENNLKMAPLWNHLQNFHHSNTVCFHPFWQSFSKSSEHQPLRQCSHSLWCCSQHLDSSPCRQISVEIQKRKENSWACPNQELQIIRFNFHKLKQLIRVERAKTSTTQLVARIASTRTARMKIHALHCTGDVRPFWQIKLPQSTNA